MPDKVTVDASRIVIRSVLKQLVDDANKLDSNDLGGYSLDTCEDCKQETVFTWDPSGTGHGHCSSCGILV